MTLIARFARSPVLLLALTSGLKSTRRTALTVLDHLLSRRGFLARYFVDEPDIFQPELDSGDLIFTGLPVYFLLARFQRCRYPLTAVTTENVFAEVAAKLHDLGYLQVSETRFWVATCPTVGPHANPYSRIMAFEHRDGLRVWLFVSPYSCLHGVLSQRHSALLNGLTGDGYFSLYPMASIVERHSLLLQAGTHAEDQRYVFSLGRIGLHLTVGSLPYGAHHTLSSGSRRFGDKYTWIFADHTRTASPASVRLSLNQWSLSQRYSWRYSRDSAMELRFISIRLLSHRLLSGTYLATSFSKAFFLQCLHVAEQYHQPRNRTSHRVITSWDAELGEMITQFQRGAPYVFLTASPHAAHYISSPLNRIAAAMQRQM